MKRIVLDGKSLSISDIHYVAHAKNKDCVSLHEDNLKLMNKSREFVLNSANSEKAIYGITTGFGALSNKFIKKSDLAQLQVNLIRSHCTGVGEPFPREVTRAIMLLRANCLTGGHSGVNPEAVELLIDFINNDITPVVPSKGSVGASGDLAPLSHVALCLIGEGDVVFNGKVVNSAFAINSIGKKPIVLGPKDGLALINGTAVMAALGSLAVHESIRLSKIADIAATMTLDGVKGSSKAYDPRISALKPQPGQLQSCQNLNKLLEGSEILSSHEDCGKVQDPYSLRCVPQVHGAARQCIEHAKNVLDIEINSVTDNPLVFFEDNDVISGGNFHGQAIALAMDYLAMGISEFGNISERRIEKMMNKEFSDLPPFLTKDSGLNSGLMIAQVTAAALASENKGLCHPASIDSIPTSTDKEDHVSMGVTSGRKLYEVIFNVKNILAIELLCNTQALSFQRPLKSSNAIEECYKLIRKHVPEIEEDRVFKVDIDNIVKLINTNELLQAVEKHTGDLL